MTDKIKLHIPRVSYVISYVGCALVAALWYRKWFPSSIGNTWLDWLLVALPLVLYVPMASSLPVFAGSLVSLLSMPRSFFEMGHWRIATWRSGKYAPVKGAYWECGPYPLFGVAYFLSMLRGLWLEHSNNEDYAIYYSIRRG